MGCHPISEGISPCFHEQARQTGTVTRKLFLCQVLMNVRRAEMLPAFSVPCNTSGCSSMMRAVCVLLLITVPHVLSGLLCNARVTSRGTAGYASSVWTLICLASASFAGCVLWRLADAHSPCLGLSGLSERFGTGAHHPGMEGKQM